MDITQRTAESLAARGFIEKSLSSVQYARLSEAFTAYNATIAQQLAIYAAQDTVHAQLLSAFALQITEMTVYEIDPVQPIFITAADLDENSHAQATDIIKDVIGLERGYVQFWQSPIFAPFAAQIGEIVDVEGLSEISRQRVFELKRIEMAIENGTLWHRENPSPFYCGRCGTRFFVENQMSKTGFSECSTCKATANFCALPFEYI